MLSKLDGRVRILFLHQLVFCLNDFRDPVVHFTNRLILGKAQSPFVRHIHYASLSARMFSSGTANLREIRQCFNCARVKTACCARSFRIPTCRLCFFEISSRRAWFASNFGMRISTEARIVVPRFVGQNVRKPNRGSRSNCKLLSISCNPRSNLSYICARMRGRMRDMDIRMDHTQCIAPTSNTFPPICIDMIRK